MEDRIALLQEFETGVFTVTDLCTRHSVSRTTFYAWKARRDSGDPRWFEERSHATETCPHRTSAAITERIVSLRERHPQLGPKKIHALLADKHPETIIGGRISLAA